MCAQSPDDLDDAALLREAMMAQLLKAGLVLSPQVEAALRAVPRHHFLPSETLDLAYANQAVPAKWIDGEVVSSASQPQMVAIMLEQLGLEAGQRVLEIGAGTGYNAALLAHAVGHSGKVTSLDIDEDIVSGARAHLLSAGYDRVDVRCVDGRAGCADAAPFDRVIVTVGVTQFPSSWHEQLAPGGHLVLPLVIGAVAQWAIALAKEDDHLVSVNSRRCQFMLMRSAGALPGGTVRLEPDGDLSVRPCGSQAVDSLRTSELLRADSRSGHSGIRLTVNELVEALDPWLALHSAGFIGLYARGAAAEERQLPALLSGRFGKEAWHVTAGWLSTDTVCLMASGTDRAPTWDGPPFSLFLHSYGSNDWLAEHALDQITAWDKAGRPSLENAQIQIYPAAAGYNPLAAESAMAHGDSLLVVRWDDLAAAT